MINLLQEKHEILTNFEISKLNSFTGKYNTQGCNKQIYWRFLDSGGKVRQREKIQYKE